MLAIPLILCSAAAVTVSKLLPDKYRSETLIMLIPQRIPDSYVKSTVTSDIQDRLATLEDQILSRSRLERIILDLDLYQSLRHTLPMEDVVQRMRGDIIPKVEGKESFRLSYVSEDAKTAQKTTERLASLFIEENLRDRENQAEDTNQFLDSQLEDARRRLVENEKRLEAYRSRYSGELPSQADANLQAIKNAQTQLQNSADASDRARERRLLLERQLIALQSDPVAVVPVPVPQGPAGEPPIQPAAQQLQAARSRLQVLLSHYKPDHPDVRTTERAIRDLEVKVKAEAVAAHSQAADPSPAAPEAPLSTAEILRQKRMRDLSAEIGDIDRQLADKQEQERQLRDLIAGYQTKLDVVPKRESELVELTRDYTTLQTTYQSLLAKREDSKIAANLERRNIGEQFKVLDPARLPERPFSPNRPLIAAGGVVAGLSIGVLLTGFLEYRDSTLKSEHDVVRLLDLPVLALVPLMISKAERRTRRRRWLFGGIAAVMVLLVGAAAIVMWRVRI